MGDLMRCPDLYFVAKKGCEKHNFEVIKEVILITEKRHLYHFVSQNMLEI